MESCKGIAQQDVVFFVGKMKFGDLAILARCRGGSLSTDGAKGPGHSVEPCTERLSSPCQRRGMRKSGEGELSNGSDTSTAEEPRNLFMDELFPIKTGSMGCADNTGLLVWPGCRVLANFLVNPLGARRHFPEIFKNAGEVYRGGSDPKLSTTIGGATFSEQGRRVAILELGAGTGLCGIVASMATARRVILTDGCDDVIENLRHNVRLNGLQGRAKVVRLAWGKRKDPSLKLELPAEIREHSPFKVIIASDTLYTGNSEAFFTMVNTLLDLLLSYIPRSPSLATVNMLRYAYQTGLRGRRLDTCELIGHRGNHSNSSSPTPVILALQPSATLSPMNTNGDQIIDGEYWRTSEAAWVSEWRGMFPGVNFKSNSGKASSRVCFGGDRNGVDSLHARDDDDGDTMTTEELWGNSSSELQAP